MADQSVRPFKIQVADEVLDDLKQRLRNTRTMPKGFNEKRMHYGQERGLQTQLLEYWRDEYDWRKHEAKLNSFDNFLCKIRGLDVHFVHQKSQHRNAVPIIMVHGWPGSVWEFHRAIPMLTDDPNAPFHVIVPSIPGYGWSEAAKEPGLNVTVVAQMFNELMIRLGYDKYYAQGGDWGALITKQMAMQFPVNCVGLHQNMPTVPFESLKVATKAMFDVSPVGKLFLSSEDQERLTNCMEYAKSGLAYLLLHSSKPHTLGDALEDSPAGLMSWIVEKCLLWADTRNGLLKALSMDDLLTNVTIYWVTNSITSSMRLYFETIPLGKRSPDQTPKILDLFVYVPTAVAFFPKEAIAFPLQWLHYGYNIVQHSQFREGGHFAAWEQPHLLVGDVKKFAHKTLPFNRAVELSEARKNSLNQNPGMGKMLTIIGVGAVAGLLYSRM